VGRSTNGEAAARAEGGGLSMTAKRNGKRRTNGSRTPEEAGTVLSRALVLSMRDTGVTRSMLAAKAERDVKTITRWRTGETFPEVQRIMPMRRLWRKFWSCVTELERKAGWL
jgi:hypothetical protein